MVATTTRYKRNGKFLEILGHYNPSDPTAKFVIDKEKYDAWKKKGAITTKAVEDLIAGTYEYVKYEPNKEEPAKEGDEAKEAEEATDTDSKEEPATEEPAAEETSVEEALQKNLQKSQSKVQYFT